MQHPDQPDSTGMAQLSTLPHDKRNNILQQQLKEYGLATLADHSHWLLNTTSTNAVAKTIRQVCGLVISNQQTSGRGQAGRQWQSPEGNLYLSLLWTLQHPVSGRLALEVALSLLNMPLLKHQPGLQIKWPNDLYFNASKWGGILIEPVNDHQVVIGVGINLVPMQSQVVDQPVTDLSQITGSAPDVLSLIVQTTLALTQACEQFEHGSIDLPTRFASADALLQKTVNVHVAGQPDIQGLVCGIQADGALIIDTTQGVKIIYSGQVRAI